MHAVSAHEEKRNELLWFYAHHARNGTQPIFGLFIEGKARTAFIRFYDKPNVPYRIVNPIDAVKRNNCLQDAPIPIFRFSLSGYIKKVFIWLTPCHHRCSSPWVLTAQGRHSN